MTLQTLSISHVAGAATTDSNDPVPAADNSAKIVAKALRTLAAKLDADAGVTDTNYLAIIDAVTI
jgi:hypothetical protein